MAKGKKTGGKDYVKGHNMGGRPPLPADLKKANQLTITKAKTILNDFLSMDIAELEGVLKDKKRTVLEHMIGRIALIGIKNGDYQRLNFMFERLIGKVKDNVEHTVIPRVVKNLDGGEEVYTIEAKDDESD